MAEDAASSDEIRHGAERGQWRMWPPATSPAWGVAAEDATASNKLRRGAWQRRTRPPATTSDVGRGRRKPRPPATFSNMVLKHVLC
ncbi:Os04g0577450 [Oryza sativa Japonica Group]|uniref:Os04g0577450 protein n=2 Tax=Oryza TaxID=4527 RepID=A0A0P0WDU9_ORYSJ|nr:Os04g0577450 [Oryza sativa Japonica Group]